MKHWNRYNPIGAEEKAAVNRVLDSGVLSKYIGAWHEDFNGGVEVNAFEHELAEYFGVPHAVVFNSLTSGLIAAMGAMGVQPGDEILVTPWSMSATATAILIWGGIPVFVDIEPDFYGIDPNRIAEKITKKTKGIIVADIFGHGARLDELRALADQHHLFLIEDVAQAPGIQLNGKFLGTWGDVGGFSLNYHKHIHTGEGGFCICHRDDIAMKMRLIRNHAESAVSGSPIDDLTNMVGFNFRLGEMEAAIGREQLKKLPMLLQQNQKKASRIIETLASETWLVTTPVGKPGEHAYYVLPFRLTDDRITNSQLAEKLRERGVPGIVCGYVNIHRLPMYQQKIAFGPFPWAHSEPDHYHYDIGQFPIAETLHTKTFIGLLISMFDLNEDECTWIANQMIAAYQELSAEVQHE